MQPDPVGHAGAEQRAEQIAPVQHEVGSAVPGREVGQVERGQLTPVDGVSEHQPAGHNGGRHYCVEHIQLVENTNGVRRQLDSRAHLSEALRALENGDIATPAGQAQRGGEPPDTAPEDQCLREYVCRHPLSSAMDLRFIPQPDPDL